MKLWRSGIFWAALSFVAGLGHLACSSVIARNLNSTPGDFGASSAAMDFVTLLGLPLQMFGMSLIHYISYFRSKNDEARLQGLLASCFSLLTKVTILVMVLAALLVLPLSRFFQFPSNLTLAIFAFGLVGFWSYFAVTLCQGMAWFKRLAIMSVVAVTIRYVFAYFMTKRFPTSSMALTSSTVSLLVNFGLFYWWKDLFRHPAERISPWTREFMQFLVVTGATVAGTYFFNTGDSLVANKYFPPSAKDAYQMAARFGRAIPATVLPLLIVTFTSRSGSKESAAKTDQRILLSLYAAGLACGSAFLILVRHPLLNWYLGKPNDAAAHMIVPFSIAMTLIGLNQAVGMWSLADRTFKIAFLYGALGLAYWTTLLLVGKTPATLLTVMPIGAGISFCVLVVCWLVNRSRQAPA